MKPLVDMRGISKYYAGSEHPITVLNHLDLSLMEGEFLGIMGKSGVGKSTLLNIIGCLDKPSDGAYWFDGMDLDKATDNELSRLRSQALGFVFQTFQLIESMTVAENIALPFLYQNTAQKIARRRVCEAIAQVGLDNRADHRPTTLSGGEMQRVAIARALAVEPRVILADEPTGNLDEDTSQEIMALLKTLHGKGHTIVLVTHDTTVAAYAERRVTMQHGRIIDEA